MYQELHMWDECIVVAEAKVQNIAALGGGLGLLGKLSGWEYIQGVGSFHLLYQNITSAWRGSKEKGRLQ